MSSYFQNQASMANRKIDSAASSLNNAFNDVKNYISEASNININDALSQNTLNSLKIILSNVKTIKDNLYSIKNSIMNTATIKDQKLDERRMKNDKDNNEQLSI